MVLLDFAYGLDQNDMLRQMCGFRGDENPGRREKNGSSTWIKSGAGEVKL